MKEELIYYERPDQDGPKCSDYVKVQYRSLSFVVCDGIIPMIYILFLVEFL